MFESEWAERHAEAARLAEMAPGVPLGAALTRTPVRALDDEALVEVVAGWERMMSWAAAAQATALAEMQRRASGSRELQYVGDEVAARLATTRRSAEMKVDLATALTRAPGVHAALGAGSIDVRKATVLTRETEHLSARDAAGILHDVLPEAPDKTAPQLRAAVRHAELALDPQAAQRRFERARAERSVSLTPAPCSMAWLTAYLPADDAMRVMTAVDAVAGPTTSGDDRDTDARRADSLVAVMADVLNSGVGPGGPLPTRQHRRPHLQVTAAATTLLGLDDAPATLAGYGPIPASMAREIAAESSWAVALTDPQTGELVAGSTPTRRPAAASGNRSTNAATARSTAASANRSTAAPTVQRTTAPTNQPTAAVTYRPSATLARRVIERDVTCTFPGCRVPATRCDIDHIEPFDPTRPADDQTRLDNLHALCRHHHRLKTHGRWTVTRDTATGTTHWTSPTGHTHTRDPVPADPARLASHLRPRSVRTHHTLRHVDLARRSDRAYRPQIEREPKHSDPAPLPDDHDAPPF